MFDDIRRNFLMNPGNGLKIRPFRQAHLNRDKDRELLKLAKYLKDIVHEEDFNSLDHKHWEKYRPRKKEQHTVKKESGDLGDNRDSSSAS
jgi:ubiquitin-like domain-containing CTD phosphatase 1